MTTPADHDVHDGATAAEHHTAFTAVFGAVATQCQRLDLRPSSVSISALFGLLSATVGLPGGDTAGVDALAGVYGLAPDDGADTIYARRGEVTDGDRDDAVTHHLMVFTTRPEPSAELAVTAAVDESATREVAAIAGPVRVEATRVAGGAR
jgi:hypothetical protein